jgi:hypothetical protein
MKKSRTKTAKTAKRGIVHHAKRVYHLTPKFIHGMVGGAFVGIIVVMTLNLIAPVAAVTVTSSRDCDTNAVINCGALTTTELQQRYSNKGVAQIYNYFGISSKDIKATDKTAVAGRVYKNGNVTVNGVTVATGATTAGRENISGSKKVTEGGVTFYTRPPSVSFRVESIAAFVVMEDGQFKFAILGACGNPVKATAVPKKKVETTPKPEIPKETPVDVPSTQTPKSTPTPKVETAAAEKLPVTGPSELLVVGLLSIIGGYLYHTIHRHFRHKRAASI